MEETEQKVKKTVEIPAILASTGETVIIKNLHKGVSSSGDLLWCRFMLGSGSEIENWLRADAIIRPEARNDEDAAFLKEIRFFSRATPVSAINCTSDVKQKVEVSPERVSAMKAAMGVIEKKEEKPVVSGRLSSLMSAMKNK